MSVSRTDLGGGVRRHVPSEDHLTRRKPVVGGDLRSAIATAASELGFVRAGVALASPFTNEARDLEQFASRGSHGSMAYLVTRNEDGRLLREDPRSVFPDVRSIISVALPYDPVRAVVGPKQGRIAGYAQGADYHLVIKEKLLDLADEVASFLGEAVQSRVCVDSAPLFERQIAARAGFSFTGKHTLSIAPGVGSYFLLGELLVDRAVEGPEPDRLPEGCGSCTACLDACPTGALPKPFQMDATRCISYLTIESKEDIPLPLRSAVGDRIFGCDVCQDVCPYNQSSKRPSGSKALGRREDLAAPELPEVLQLSASRHRRLVAQTALRRASRDQLARNAAVALGNSASAEAVTPLLEAAENHRSLQVRRHARWALEELAKAHEVPEAKAALSKLLELKPRVD